jgi:hypothetical protein
MRLAQYKYVACVREFKNEYKIFMGGHFVNLDIDARIVLKRDPKGLTAVIHLRVRETCWEQYHNEPSGNILSS